MTERQRKINLPTAVNLLWGGVLLDGLAQKYFVLNVCHARIILNN